MHFSLQVSQTCIYWDTSNLFGAILYIFIYGFVFFYDVIQMIILVRVTPYTYDLAEEKRRLTNR